MGPGQLHTTRTRRRGRLGESTMGCLLFIALVLGGSIWAYFKFVAYRHLVNADAPKAITTFDPKENPPAYLEYGRRFRDQFAQQVRFMVSQQQTMITRFKKGEYKNNPEKLEQQLKEYINALNDSVSDFNGQQVPAPLKNSHVNVAKCYRLCYESALALQSAAASEGADRTMFLKQADDLLLKAWRAGNAGVTLHKQLWNSP
jgi:hypothetical protein